ncbi:MAG: OmpA family protein [Paracoccaceae bacterium]|nr:OmpA family protein [Paracoccaceae bacterium]
MRDFFAIIAIILAVVALGVFRVPDENALVTAGIRAAAEGEIYQEPRPVSVEVSGRTVTISGRLRDETLRGDLVGRLAALEGVEEVIDERVLLPEAAPFVLRIEKDAEGLRFEGVVASLDQAARLGELTGEGEPGLTLATGVPDAQWADLSYRGATALMRMEHGVWEMQDRSARLSGQVHLPVTKRQIGAALAELPEGYTLVLDVEALDDGTPYRLQIVRDPLMGQRVTGKVPPDWSLEMLDWLGDRQEVQIDTAPLPLDQPGFAEAVALALPVFAELPSGSLTVAPGLVSLSGGPASPELFARAEALQDALPQDYALTLALVPADSGAPLGLRVTWTGAEVEITGHVPQDFDLDRVAESLGAPVAAMQVTRQPYPDLDNWAGPVWTGLDALALLQSGVLEIGPQEQHLRGVAADPLARQRAAAALGGAGSFEAQLADDGRPPDFTLRYDAATGAAVTGKLTADLTPAALAGALGLDQVRGTPTVAPSGDGSGVLAALKALAPVLAEVDVLSLRFAETGTDLTVEATPGADLAVLRSAIASTTPDTVTWVVDTAEAPLSGTRRTHVILQHAQVFADGYWLPEIAVPVKAEACTNAMAKAAPVPFQPGKFTPALGATPPLAELAAIARACSRTDSLHLTIAGLADSHQGDALNRQLGRRRAEAVRAALIDRGVDAGRITVRSTDPQPGREALVFTWAQRR